MENIIERNELEIICKTIIVEIRRNRPVEFTENSRNKLVTNLGPTKVEIKNTGKGRYILTYFDRTNKREGKLNSRHYQPLKELGDHLFGRDIENNEFPESPVFDYFTSEND